MRNTERTTHPAGSLGPGARRNLHRTERHRAGNAIRVMMARRSDDLDEPTPKPRRDFAAALRYTEYTEVC